MKFIKYESEAATGFKNENCGFYFWDQRFADPRFVFFLKGKIADKKCIFCANFVFSKNSILEHHFFR